MKRSDPIGYYVIALLALSPIGLRALTRSNPHPQAVGEGTVQAGQVLFLHEWTPRDPLAVGGDGLGPVFNATSCVACHNQGGVGGGGGVKHNVTMFTTRPERPGDKPRQGVVHAFAIKCQETLAQVDPALPPIARPTLQQVIDFASPANRLPPVS